MREPEAGGDGAKHLFLRLLLNCGVCCSASSEHLCPLWFCHICPYTVKSPFFAPFLMENKWNTHLALRSTSEYFIPKLSTNISNASIYSRNAFCLWMMLNRSGKTSSSASNVYVSGWMSPLYHHHFFLNDTFWAVTTASTGELIVICIRHSCSPS